MKFFNFLLVSSFSAVVITGCGNKEESQYAVIAYEGDSPGECSDEADNDRNGYFDCQDKNCWGSPACAGNNTGMPIDAGQVQNDTDVMMGTSATKPDASMPMNSDLTDLKGLELVYSQRVDVQGSFEATYCAQYMICDCLNLYTGTGVAIESVTNRVTFEGTWRLEQSDCHNDLQQMTWVDSSEKAFHSFVFSLDTRTVDSWLAHGVAGSVEPLPNPKSNKQWYITQMGALYDANSPTVVHSEVQADATDPLAPIELTHTVTISFSLQ